jgi:hypothetical protein
MEALGGERRYSSYSFTTSALDGVSGQHHTPASLYSRAKDPRYLFDRRLGGPHIGMIESHEDRETVEPPPTIAEVEAAIGKLKNNKAPGMDLIQAELVKHAGVEYTKHLYQLIIKIWINEIIPEDWNSGII